MASYLQTGFGLRIVHMEFLMNKVALGHVFLSTLMSCPVNKHSTNVTYLFIYHPRDEQQACQEPSSTKTLSHPTMRINNTQCWHDGQSWVTDFKKLPQILNNLQPIQAKNKKKSGLQIAHTQNISQFVPYILQEYPTDYKTLSSPKITYPEHT